MLGSWHSLAVLETCRGVTQTGFNRLACPARLTLPAVADSLRFGGSGLSIRFRWRPPVGSVSPTLRLLHFSGGRLRGVRLSRAVCQGPPVSGLPVYSYGDLKESMSRFSFWALAVAAPAGSDFLLPVFPPTF